MLVRTSIMNHTSVDYMNILLIRQTARARYLIPPTRIPASIAVNISEELISFGRGSFLVLTAPWDAESLPGPSTQVWALAEVRARVLGVQSGKSPRGAIPST